MQQDSTLRNMCPVRPLQVDEFLNKSQGCFWCQYDISLAEHRLVGPFQFLTTGSNKLKYPNMIDEKQLKALEKEVGRKVINTSDIKEVVPLGW